MNGFQQLLNNNLILLSNYCFCFLRTEWKVAFPTRSSLHNRSLSLLLWTSPPFFFLDTHQTERRDNGATLAFLKGKLGNYLFDTKQWRAKSDLGPQSTGIVAGSVTPFVNVERTSPRSFWVSGLIRREVRAIFRCRASGHESWPRTRPSTRDLSKYCRGESRQL